MDEGLTKIFFENSGMIIKETIAGLYMIFFTVLYLLEKKEHKMTIERNHLRELELLKEQMKMQEETNNVIEKTIEALKGKENGQH